MFISIKNTRIFIASLFIQFFFINICCLPIYPNEIKKAVIYGLSDCYYYQMGINILNNLSYKSSFIVEKHPMSRHDWDITLPNLKKKYNTTHSTSPFIILYDENNKIIYLGGSDGLKKLNSSY